MLDTELDLNPPPSSRTARLMLECKEEGRPIAIAVNGGTKSRFGIQPRSRCCWT